MNLASGETFTMLELAKKVSNHIKNFLKMKFLLNF